EEGEGGAEGRRGRAGPARGPPRGGALRPAARHAEELAWLLRGLRSALHVVGGEAVEGRGPRARGVRVAPARQVGREEGRGGGAGGGADRERGAPGGAGAGDDPIHGGGADRGRRARVRLVRGAHEGGVARARLRRRLGEGPRARESEARRARKAAG